MTTPIPFQVDPTRFDINQLQSVRDVDQVKVIARAFEAQIHLLEAQATYAREMHKLISEHAARLAKQG